MQMPVQVIPALIAAVPFLNRVVKENQRILNFRQFDLHGRFLTAEDVDKFLCELPKISYFGEAGLKANSPEEAAELVSWKLAQLNQV